MSYWVHIEQDGKPWHEAQVFEPPTPQPVPGKGFPVFLVQFDQNILWFSSLAELRVCIATLSQRALPSNLILSNKRGQGYGPSNHWLNRFPSRKMTWPYRQRLAKYLVRCLKEFEAEAKQAA